MHCIVSYFHIHTSFVYQELQRAEEKSSIWLEGSYVLAFASFYLNKSLRTPFWGELRHQISVFLKEGIAGSFSYVEPADVWRLRFFVQQVNDTIYSDGNKIRGCHRLTWIHPAGIEGECKLANEHCSFAHSYEDLRQHLPHDYLTLEDSVSIRPMPKSLSMTFRDSREEIVDVLKKILSVTIPVLVISPAGDEYQRMQAPLGAFRSTKNYRRILLAVYSVYQDTASAPESDELLLAGDLWEGITVNHYVCSHWSQMGTCPMLDMCDDFHIDTDRCTDYDWAQSVFIAGAKRKNGYSSNGKPCYVALYSNH